MVEYIDFLEETRIEDFLRDEKGVRLALQFGRDNFHQESRGELDLDKRDKVQGYFKRVTDFVKESFGVEEDLYVCSFWLAKQYPGAVIEIHEDTDDGANTHFRYSGIIYLNTMGDGGDLSFVDFDYLYKPAAGDLVTFPSQETGHHGVAEINEVRYSLLFWMTDQEHLAIG